MGLFKELPQSLTEVDIIIAGGGTAGCIVAARLADADPNLSILVIEGGSNNDLPTVTFPIFFSQNLTPASKANIFYQTAPENQLNDRQVIVPAGGVLGGGSSTNLMMYTRAQRSDIDAWGVPGWSSDELLPYLKKLETYHGVDRNNSHGRDGPIQVSTSTFTSSRLQDQFISAVEKVGWPASDDLQDLDSSNGIGVQRALRYISPDGARQDTATRYLHPRLQSRLNLHVLLETSVIRVLFDNNKRATAVEFTRNPLYSDPSTPSPSPIHTITARKTIILSSGALGTPPILERSGLGDPAILTKAGVPVMHPLPGVGSSYEDHQLCIYPYHSSLTPSETADSLALGRVDPVSVIQRNDPILGWNAMDVTCKLRPLSQKDITSLGPAFEKAWKRDYEDVPDKPLAMMAPVGCFPQNPAIIAGEGADKQYFSVSCFTVHPYSRGHVHITGPELTAPLDFRTGFLGDAEGVDVKMHVWLYKTQREIVRRMSVYRGEVSVCHPPFPEGSKAKAIELSSQLDGEVPNIEYTHEDDAVIEQWVRQNVGTTWHSLGTTKIGSVVDNNLNVLGVSGLKIADLSVLPGNVAANTNNMAMVVGEKAADIIIKELGL
ncbi:putative GMC oxidoreductase [Triangularia verruculosa]|uniref:GMC oxidoreductase n=1 Tax=Triangularia verruculosa TaxID=2587418 RepID=A0AAN6XK37_9PEZI|nr:putative GMC oxidoreductase [Triangularia verruculosa]